MNDDDNMFVDDRRQQEDHRGQRDEGGIRGHVKGVIVAGAGLRYRGKKRSSCIGTTL